MPKSYTPKKGEEMNRSTYSTMRYTAYAGPLNVTLIDLAIWQIKTWIILGKSRLVFV